MFKKSIILFFISLIVNLIFIWLSPEHKSIGDELEYISLATNISQGKGFVRDNGEPAVYRPPLFSYLLGIWFKISGDCSLRSISVFQSLIQALAVVVAFLLFKEILLNDMISFYAGIFLAFNPILFTTVVFVLQENILMLTTVLSALLTVKWIKKPNYKWSIFAGLCWGFTTLGKVVTWYVPLLIIIVPIFAKFVKSLEFKITKRQVLIFVIAFLIPIFPWTLRNYKHFNRFILINAQGQGLLIWIINKGMFGEPEGAEAKFKKFIFGIEDKVDGKNFYKNLKGKNLTPKEEKKEMFKYIISHPKHLFFQIFWNFIHFPQISRSWFRYVARVNMSWKYWIIPTLILQLPLYIGYFAVFLERKRAEILFLSFFYLSYWLEYSILWGEARFNLPVYPILLCLGLYGWMVFIVKTQKIHG